ncbi:hypothetical protein C8A05DRAFT_39074 [Staphylotrichum tortipilum]|uniref:Tetratricopeptide repeat protein n=1 Tax=Staphylotrichum tortipilum TaxID=2831512 RepID=A0AAN6MC12_9PEZI|nr:hypothetical protein C8A05DRAFT_39074 [Staphylotrichum longicolle]
MFRVFPRLPEPEEEPESWPMAAMLTPHLALGRFYLHSGAFEGAADLSQASFAMAQETMGVEYELIPAPQAECLIGLELLESGAPPAAPAGTTGYNKQKAALLQGLGRALNGKHNFRRLDEIFGEQIRLEQAKPWSLDDVQNRLNLAEGMARNGKWAEAKAINDELLAFCETEAGMKIDGKRLQLVTLNQRGLILRSRPDALRRDEIIALYDHVLCETLSNFGIEHINTWIALKNRVSSVIEAVRMEELGSVLWTVLPAATAAKVKAEDRLSRLMQTVYQGALAYLNYYTQNPPPSSSPTGSAAEFSALLARWRYVSNFDAAPEPDCIDHLNLAGVLLQHRGRYAEAEAQHRAALAELALRSGQNESMNQMEHYNLMLAIARDARVDEARAFREEKRELVAPMEAVYRTLDARLEQGERERGVYDEAGGDEEGSALDVP